VTLTGAGIVAEMSDDEVVSLWMGLQKSYFPTARDKQLPPPGDWFVWLLLAGRGFGKTRVGAEWIIENALASAGDYAVVAPTEGKGRDVCIEDPKSGLLAVLLRRREKPASYNRSSGELQIRLENGSRIKVVSADKPDAARGFNLSAAWCDEISSWRYEETWYEALVPALRVGPSPRVVVTSTPRPTTLVRDLVGRDDGSVVVTRGSTWENAENLAPSALAELRARYEGTRIGRQELEGELLEDVEGALWQREWIDNARLQDGMLVPTEFVKLVVAIDPALTASPTSDETGIVAAGSTRRGHCPVCGSLPKESRHAFVLADESCRESPLQWARIAWALHDRLRADRLVAERNGGYDLVEQNLRTVAPGMRFEMVNASRGKQLRAGPVADVYEQGSVHHVGSFPQLEDQLCTWDPEDAHGKSPDRLDALVYAITALDMRMQSPVDTSAHRAARTFLPPVKLGVR
jgi:phage terminase large subunit-like protein